MNETTGVVIGGIIFILLLLFAWWMSRVGGKAPEAHVEAQEPAPVTRAAPTIAAQPDDLTVLEGVGPRIASVLAAAGITTFAELASTSVDRLEEILRAADLRLGDPTTWPEQAALAAKGDWDGLAKLTETLKGGRRA